MNQMDFEDLFRDDNEPKLSELDQSVFTFSKGNHKRSLLGDEWYYYGETREHYALYKDVVVRETSTSVFIDMYEEAERLNSTPICIDKVRFNKVYPAQPLFPVPMGEREAREILRKHFMEQEERSTTIESIGE